MKESKFRDVNGKPFGNTTVRQEEGCTVVRLHNTDIVRFSDDFIWLNTDGWASATTKRRMNQASESFGLGFHVFQKDFCWFVTGAKERRGTTVVGTGHVVPFDWQIKIPRRENKLNREAAWAAMPSPSTLTRIGDSSSGWALDCDPGFAK